MKIYLDKQNKYITKKFRGKASELLKELNINPETIIIIKNEELVSEDTLLKDIDIIKILSIVSAG